MDSRIEDFLQILRQGAFIFMCSAQVEFPNALEKVNFAVANRRKSSQYKHGNQDSLFIAEDQTSLSTI
jgi:hypothetical protein